MSLKSTFLAFKNSLTSCPNWRERGGGNLDKIQKNSNFVFRETFPKMKKLTVLSEMIAMDKEFSTPKYQ